MGQDFELRGPKGDRLLDTLPLLEINGDLARRSIADTRSAFTRLFPYFFPKKIQPYTFSELAKHFIPEEDLGLAFRQENLKIGVEGTIALVPESQQSIDWAKAGETKRMNKEKWQSLIKAAKPHSKKILSFLGYKLDASSSTARPEVK
jgi:ADP-heptose:LPS heptosyltransferase